MINEDFKQIANNAAREAQKRSLENRGCQIFIVKME